MGNPWDGLVVVCGTSFWEGTPLLEHHIAEHLSRYAPVLYVQPPISRLTRFRSEEAQSSGGRSGLRIARPNLAILGVRVAPLKGRPGVRGLAQWQTRNALRRARFELGSPSVRAVLLPSLDKVFGAVDEDVSVFYVKDDYVAGAELVGMNKGRLKRWYEQRLREADVVVAVSPYLAASIKRPGVRPIVVPNGVDPELFSATVPPLGQVAAGTAAFVGHLSDRVDTDLLLAVAEAGVRLRVVGPRQQTMSGRGFDQLFARKNVEWLGRVPYPDLPRVLGNTTTCLLPYSDNPFNRASFPLKILEYLAAGRRVVSTDLPSVSWLNTPLVDVATGRQDFVTAVLNSLEEPLRPEEMAERRSFAARHSWESRAAEVARAIGVGLPELGGSERLHEP